MTYRDVTLSAKIEDGMVKIIAGPAGLSDVVLFEYPLAVAESGKPTTVIAMNMSDKIIEESRQFVGVFINITVPTDADVTRMGGE